MDTTQPVVDRIRARHKAREASGYFGNGGEFAHVMGYEPHADCRELLEWIDEMRQQSKLVDTPDGPKLLVPYSFVK